MFRNYFVTAFRNIVKHKVYSLINILRSKSLYPLTDAPDFTMHGGSVPSGFELGISAPAGTPVCRHSWGERTSTKTISPEAYSAVKAIISEWGKGHGWLPK